MKIGAQLYTVRDFTKTPEDLAETLKRVADIGYTTVQVSGTCKFEPEWMKEMLDECGLKCVLTHTNPDRLRNETETVFREHQVFGCSYIGIGSMPLDMRGSLDGIKSFAEAFLPSAKKLRELGGKLFYHNHAFELIKYEGKTMLDRISELFPKDTLGFTLDTYWIQAGGGDVVQWIKKLEGRLECVHFKDMTADNESKSVMAPIYEGNMNFDAIIEACLDVGCEYALIEQDHCYDDNPFDCLKKSFDNIISRYPSLK